MKRIFHFSFPLIAVFAAAGIGKWVSRQSHWLALAEEKLGITVSRLLLGSDNPSLILGALSLILSLILLRRLSRENPGTRESRSGSDKIAG